NLLPICLRVSLLSRSSRYIGRTKKTCSSERVSCASERVFDVEVRQRLHVDLSMNVLDGDRDLGRRSRWCERERLDGRADGRHHEERSGQKSKLTHGNLPLASESGLADESGLAGLWGRREVVDLS